MELEKLKHPKSPVLLDTKETAVKIKRTPGAVRNLVARRLIPYRKAGGRLYFFGHELDIWIDQAPGVRLEDLHD
jgi:Helix-turn-helix domain